MSGTLYVVATPIGNLEDITLRALRVLREVALVAAEDTRRTAKLLHHHGIKTRTISFHEHNTHARVPELIHRLEHGDSIALVSDAGTPVLSDPGLELVRACLDRGITVDPIPGPSAALAALVASGFPAEPVTFLGYAPSKSNARSAWFVHLSTIPHTLIFFEAPHRILASLKEAGRYLGDRPLAVARELTKLHQEVLHGTAMELAERLKRPRGEFTVVIGPERQSIEEPTDIVDDSELAREFWQLTEAGSLSRREAITELAKKHNRPARAIYASLEKAKRPVS